jgi:hypothetical protein
LATAPDFTQMGIIPLALKSIFELLTEVGIIPAAVWMR